MHDEALLGPWVRRFLLEHVVAERNLARNWAATIRMAGPATIILAGWVVRQRRLKGGGL